MGNATRRGTFEERKAQAVEKKQKDWEKSIDANFTEQYAEHCSKHPDMTDDNRAKLREGLVALAEGFKKTPAPDIF